MAKLNQPSTESPADRDDLQQIKGIGPFTAEALNNVGIYRYSDLANFTPESLANLLKTATSGITPHRIERDNWLGQAQTLARYQHKPGSQTETEAESLLSAEDQREPTDQASPPPLIPAKEENTLAAESEERNEVNTIRPNWRELADFFVSFGYRLDEEGEEQLETRIHYSQIDTSEQWMGIAASQLLDWMMAQANLPLPPEAETEVEEAPAAELPSTGPAAEDAVMLELSDLWVSEVRSPALSGGQQSGGMLQAKSRLSLSGPVASKLTHRKLPFRVELYLVNIKTNRSKLIVSHQDQLIPGDLSYEIQQNFPLPTIGHYQLYLVAMLLPPGDAATHLQGPVIRVEPS